MERTLICEVILCPGDEIPSFVEVRIDDDVGFYGVGGELSQCSGQSREEHDILYVAKSRRLKRSSGSLGQANLGHLEELSLPVFQAKTGQALQVGAFLPQLAQLASYHSNFRLTHSAHATKPFLALTAVPPHLPNKETQGVGQCGRREALELQVQGRSFEKVSTQPVIFFSELGMSLHQLVVTKRRGCGQHCESCGKYESSFHREYVLRLVGVVTDVDQILNLGDLVGLMVLGCDPKGSDAKQLKSIPADSLNRQIQIDQLNHKEVGLACQLVFLMHIDQPIQQHSSHVLTEIGLDREVVAHSEPAGVGQHESFYLRSVQFLLRNGLEGGLRSIGERQIGWVVFIVDEGLFLGLDMACLTKFHSKQQRMNNEIVYTHLQDLQSSIIQTQETGIWGRAKGKGRAKEAFYPFFWCSQG